MDVNPIRHNLHGLSLNPISTGIPLYPEPSKDMWRIPSKLTP